MPLRRRASARKPVDNLDSAFPFYIRLKAFLNTELRDLTNQSQRQWLIQWKLNRPFSRFIFRKIFLKNFYSRWCWIKSDMMPECGKSHQYPLVRKCRHAPFQPFFSARRCFADAGIHFTKFCPCFLWCRFNIPGNRFRFFLFCNHSIYYAT
jgi:hypothetical protein